MTTLREETALQASFRSIEDLQLCGINVSEISILKDAGIIVLYWRVNISKPVKLSSEYDFISCNLELQGTQSDVGVSRNGRRLFFYDLE